MKNYSKPEMTRQEFSLKEKMASNLSEWLESEANSHLGSATITSYLVES